MAAVKTSPPRSTTSPASSPEATVAEQAVAPAVQQPVQKRKGGRKPVYATQEERKMRNRAAQAAFRERRTEYIKHLENTIKQHEEQLSGLQQTSRLAADEVLMLRYKNSLLERILLEKGIDVAAELRTYTGAPQQLPPRPQPLGPPPQTQPLSHQQISHPPPLSQTGSLHRPALNRRPSQQQQQHKALLGRQDGLFIKASPDPLRAPNPNMPSPSIPTPPSSTAFSFPPRAQDITQPPSTGPQPYYPSPYQTHMEELGKLPRQEYEAELLENADEENRSPLDQQPTPDSRGDAEMTITAPVSQPTPATNPQSNLYSLFDNNFDSMFSGDTTPKPDAGLSDMMRQYSLPFGFATSNMR